MRAPEPVTVNVVRRSSRVIILLLVTVEVVFSALFLNDSLKSERRSSKFLVWELWEQFAMQLA
jgi:hypothetical protein